MTFSEIVRARMQELGICTSELARRTGYSQQYLGELLNGRLGKRWNETVQTKVCEVLGIEIDYRVKTA